MKTGYTVIATDGTECGHNHRTQANAEACQRDLLAYNSNTQMWSARWHNSYVRHNACGLHVSHEQHGYNCDGMSPAVDREYRERLIREAAETPEAQAREAEQIEREREAGLQ